MTLIEGITRFCFVASFAVALALELLRLVRPSRAVRGGAAFAGGAGLLAQTLYLLMHQPSPASPPGSLLLLAWVLAVFYLYGSLHHPRVAWGIFVLPLVLGLLGLSAVLHGSKPTEYPSLSSLSGERFWGVVHGGLLLLAAVGVSVGFLASVMYLIQARRLRNKTAPLEGLRLLSLERLELMNRRGIDWAFPLLTAGLLLGALLMYFNRVPASDWAAFKVIGTGGLWLVFLLLMYLRYGVHLPGRRLALLTIATFGLMLVTLVAAHPVAVAEGMR